MKNLTKLIALLALLALIVAACGDDDDGGTSETTEPTTTSTAAPTTTDDMGDDDMSDDDMSDDDMEETTTTAAPPPADDMDDDMDGPVTVRWFIGLGTGSDVEIIPRQQELVDQYNASQDEIFIEAEFVDNEQAYGVLNTQLAAGDPPDIVGPVGIRGRDGFPGAWLDLQPLVDARGYDLSDFDPDLVQFYEVEGEGLLGIPFGVFPSMLFYNVDLFDEAGLAYPPTEYGAPYITAEGEEKPWNLETMRELACWLTVDGNGNDCSSPDFNTDDVVQFGWGNLWTDMRGLATLFGAGNLVDDNGMAIIPDSYREAMLWYQELAWQDNSYPFADWGGSEQFGAGNWFNSGNFGMANVHLWYATCCLADIPNSWQIAPIPEGPRGHVAKLHADTFAITKQSENPEAAFTALEWLLGPAANDLLQIYGGMPARISLQENFFVGLDEGQFAGLGIDWEVAKAGLAFNDNPNHEAGLPNSQESQDCYNRITNQLFVNPDFDVNAALDQLVVDLQNIYDGTGTCTLDQ